VRPDQLVEVTIEDAVDIRGLEIGAVVRDLLVREQDVAADLRAPLDLEAGARASSCAFASRFASSKS